MQAWIERGRERERERERKKKTNYREGTVQQREAAGSRDVFHYVFSHLLFNLVLRVILVFLFLGAVVAASPHVLYCD